MIQDILSRALSALLILVLVLMPLGPLMPSGKATSLPADCDLSCQTRVLSDQMNDSLAQTLAPVDENYVENKSSHFSAIDPALYERMVAFNRGVGWNKTLVNPPGDGQSKPNPSARIESNPLFAYTGELSLNSDSVGLVDMILNPEYADVITVQSLKPVFSRANKIKNEIIKNLPKMSETEKKQNLAAFLIFVYNPMRDSMALLWQDGDEKYFGGKNPLVDLAVFDPKLLSADHLNEYDIMNDDDVNFSSLGFNATEKSKYFRNDAACIRDNTLIEMEPIQALNRNIDLMMAKDAEGNYPRAMQSLAFFNLLSKLESLSNDTRMPMLVDVPGYCKTSPDVPDRVHIQPSEDTLEAQEKVFDAEMMRMGFQIDPNAPVGYEQITSNAFAVRSPLDGIRESRHLERIAAIHRYKEASEKAAKISSIVKGTGRPQTREFERAPPIEDISDFNSVASTFLPGVLTEGWAPRTAAARGSKVPGPAVHEACYNKLKDSFGDLFILGSRENSRECDAPYYGPENSKPENPKKKLCPEPVSSAQSEQTINRFLFDRMQEMGVKSLDEVFQDENNHFIPPEVRQKLAQNAKVSLPYIDAARPAVLWGLSTLSREAAHWVNAKGEVNRPYLQSHPEVRQIVLKWKSLARPLNAKDDNDLIVRVAQILRKYYQPTQPEVEESEALSSSALSDEVVAIPPNPATDSDLDKIYPFLSRVWDDLQDTGRLDGIYPEATLIQKQYEGNNPWAYARLGYLLMEYDLKNHPARFFKGVSGCTQEELSRAPAIIATKGKEMGISTPLDLFNAEKLFKVNRVQYGKNQTRYVSRYGVPHAGTASDRQQILNQAVERLEWENDRGLANHPRAQSAVSTKTYYDALAEVSEGFYATGNRAMAVAQKIFNQGNKERPSWLQQEERVVYQQTQANRDKAARDLIVGIRAATHDQEGQLISGIEEAFQSGDYDRAAELADSLLEENPEAGATWNAIVNRDQEITRMLAHPILKEAAYDQIDLVKKGIDSLCSKDPNDPKQLMDIIDLTIQIQDQLNQRAGLPGVPQSVKDVMAKLRGEGLLNFTPATKRMFLFFGGLILSGVTSMGCGASGPTLLLAGAACATAYGVSSATMGYATLWFANDAIANTFLSQAKIDRQEVFQVFADLNLTSQEIADRERTGMADLTMAAVEILGDLAAVGPIMKSASKGLQAAGRSTGMIGEEFEVYLSLRRLGAFSIKDDAKLIAQVVRSGKVPEDLVKISPEKLSQNFGEALSEVMLPTRYRWFGETALKSVPKHQIEVKKAQEFELLFTKYISDIDKLEQKQVANLAKKGGTRDLVLQEKIDRKKAMKRILQEMNGQKNSSGFELAKLIEKNSDTVGHALGDLPMKWREGVEGLNPTGAMLADGTPDPLVKYLYPNRSILGFRSRETGQAFRVVKAHTERVLPQDLSVFAKMSNSRNRAILALSRGFQVANDVIERSSDRIAEQFGLPVSKDIVKDAEKFHPDAEVLRNFVHSFEAHARANHEFAQMKVSQGTSEAQRLEREVAETKLEIENSKRAFSEGIVQAISDPKNKQFEKFREINPEFRLQNGATAQKRIEIIEKMVFEGEDAELAKRLVELTPTRYLFGFGGRTMDLANRHMTSKGVSEWLESATKGQLDELRKYSDNLNEMQGGVLEDAQREELLRQATRSIDFLRYLRSKPGH